MSTDTALRTLSDDRLLSELAALIATNRATTAKLLAHIGEVDARKLYCARGYPSMHAYCTGVLHLSEAAAYKRIAAARAARRFPAIYERVARGQLHVSGIAVLAPHLTADNHEQLLQRATHLTKRAIEALVVEVAPRPDAPARVRKLPASSAAQAPLLARATNAVGPARAPAPAPAPAVLQPLAPSRFKVQLTIDDATRDRLRRVQALLRHQVPDGDLATIFDRALGELEAALMKGKFALTDSPRTAAEDVVPTPGSRHIPAAVRRAVLARDGMRCAYVSADGKRCEETGGLEFHHIEAFAKGGPATVENTGLLCRAHNRYLGEKEFGANAMRPSRARQMSAVYGRGVRPSSPGGAAQPAATSPSRPRFRGGSRRRARLVGAGAFRARPRGVFAA